MKAVARRIFGDKGFIVAALAAIVLGTLVYSKSGGDAVWTALHADVHLFVEIGIMVPAVLLLSAVVQVMMPKGLIERWLGASSGFTGIFVATLAGAFTPGGPFMAFPLVRALYLAGADWALKRAFDVAVSGVVLVAGLLHDAGKGRIGLWPRVAYSLGQLYGPWVWRAAGRLPGWGDALEQLRVHPEPSARLAAEAGCGARTVELIRDQAHPQDAEYGAALRLADEAS